MSRDAASPGEDFKVAVAGPLATFGVILLCLAIDMPIVGTSRLGHAIVLDSSIRITPVLLSLSWLLLMNVLLLAFNLAAGVPARRRPDGAIDRLAGDRGQAPGHRSRRSAWARGFALLMAGFGLWC